MPATAGRAAVGLVRLVRAALRTNPPGAALELKVPGGLRTRTQRTNQTVGSTPAANCRLNALFSVLNQTETLFPGTNLRLVFDPLSPPANGEAVPDQIPPDQDV